MHLQFLITYSMIVFLPTVSWTGTCRRPRNEARLACKTCYLLRVQVWVGYSSQDKVTGGINLKRSETKCRFILMEMCNPGQTR